MLGESFSGIRQLGLREGSTKHQLEKSMDFHRKAARPSTLKPKQAWVKPASRHIQNIVARDRCATATLQARPLVEAFGFPKGFELWLAFGCYGFGGQQKFIVPGTGEANPKPETQNP